ncbi:MULTISPECIES: J domain-containing protein [unclassified Sphingomonas]|uniref:J domain-containing protein n=1 Tax=unclassified Sphingomonas TaxID=196159 RepID=UPI002AB4358D|nr:J domain-containing protein [Sphingomonas sp. 10B4]MDY7523731.1 J domain-containing protein [Sphingomonas sp. 10B4]MEB0283212.1 J domain-containing protein [Sphingomonas sp. 10B4]
MAREDDKKDGARERPAPRFHGRVEGTGRVCEEPGCDEAGEFRAPAGDSPRMSGDGPRPYRWFCLDHVRAFNARYNFFTGMSAEEIHAQQRPFAGWERETRAFAHSGADVPPKWGDFSDPLDAIGARFRRAAEPARKDGRPLSEVDRRSLKVLGLAADVDRRGLRERYAELVRKYHPDRNGGDRGFEAKLQEVIAAYTQLKGAPAFA